MTKESYVPNRCGRFTTRLRHNLEKYDNPMDAGIATALDTCGNCEGHFKCAKFFLTECGFNFEKIPEAAAKVLLGCGEYHSWCYNSTNEVKAIPKPKIRCEWNTLPKEVTNQ